MKTNQQQNTQVNELKLSEEHREFRHLKMN